MTKSKNTKEISLRVKEVTDYREMNKLAKKGYIFRQAWEVGGVITYQMIKE